MKFDKVSKNLDKFIQQPQLPDYIRAIITKDSHGRKPELLIPAALDLERPKRPRTIFQNFQIEAMEREFQQCPFVSKEKRAILANEFGLTKMQVKVWFQNRRTKARKMNDLQESFKPEN